MPEGRGIILTHKNKLLYEGEFSKGKKEGKGKMNMEKHQKYEGEFKAGKFNGEGKFIFTNGDSWKGTFKNGIKEGMGILYVAKINQDFNVYCKNDEMIWNLTKQNGLNTGMVYKEIITDEKYRRTPFFDIWKEPQKKGKKHFTKEDTKVEESKSLKTEKEKETESKSKVFTTEGISKKFESKEENDESAYLDEMNPIAILYSVKRKIMEDYDNKKEIVEEFVGRYNLKVESSENVLNFCYFLNDLIFIQTDLPIKELIIQGLNFKDHKKNK